LVHHNNESLKKCDFPQCDRHKDDFCYLYTKFINLFEKNLLFSPLPWGKTTQRHSEERSDEESKSCNIWILRKLRMTIPPLPPLSRGDRKNDEARYQRFFLLHLLDKGRGGGLKGDKLLT